MSIREKGMHYIDYTDILILVSITDMWYIYIDGFIFDYGYIPDGLFHKLGGDSYMVMRQNVKSSGLFWIHTKIPVVNVNQF